MVEAFGDAPLVLGGLMIVSLCLLGCILVIAVRRSRKSKLKHERPTSVHRAESQIIPEPPIQPAEAGGVDLKVGTADRRVDIDLRTGQLHLSSHRLELAVSGVNPSCVLASVSRELTSFGLSLVRKSAPSRQWAGDIFSNDDKRVGAVAIVALAPGYWSFVLNVAPSLPLQTIAEKAIVSCGYRRNLDQGSFDPQVRAYLTNNLSHIRASVGGAEVHTPATDRYFA